MTNAEKYLKDGIDVNEFADKIYDAYINGKDNESVFTTTVEWLRQQAKPKLIEDERVILRNILPEWKTIFRGNLGTLELHNEKGGWTAFYPMSHLFQFIKERRRIRNRRIIRRVKMTKKRKDEIANKIKQLEKELSGMPTGFYTGVNGKAIRIQETAVFGYIASMQRIVRR